jgi:hypothetical protein
VLLLFEGLSGVLHCARGVPPRAWLTAAAIYLVYLCLVVTALRPRQLTNACGRDRSWSKGPHWSCFARSSGGS